MRRLSLFLLLLVSLFPLPPAARAQNISSITRQDGLPSDGVTALSWDGIALWVGTTQGLGRWEAGRTSTVELPLNEHHVVSLHDTESGLWVGTAMGIARLQSGDWRSWEKGDDGLASSWGAAFTTHQSMTVVGLYGGGVQQWTGEQWMNVGDGAPRQVTALASDGDTLWAGTPTGLWGWDGTRWVKQPDRPLNSSHVYSISADERIVAVGTADGVVQSAQQASVRVWEPVAGTAPAIAITLTPNGVVTPQTLSTVVQASGRDLPASPITSLLYAQGQLFAGSLGGGVQRFSLDDEEAPSDSAEPLPILLLHGRGDSSLIAESNFRFLAMWLERDGYDVTMVSYDEEAPLLDKAATLRRAIRDTLKESGKSELFIIGHSYGGLVARFLLASGAEPVAGLVTLGTPHAGARLIYDFIVPDLDASSSNSLRELLPEHAALVEPFAEEGKIAQLHIGGNLLPRNGLLEGFPPNDGIISAASALSAPGATRLLPVAHGWSLELLERGISSLLWPDPVYVNTIRPWLQGAANGRPVSDREDDLPLPSSGQTRMPLLDRQLEPGEELTTQIDLDGSPATWFLSGNGVTMDLVAPDGTRYRSETITASQQVVHLPPGSSPLRAIDLWSTNELPGSWRAVVTNRTSARTQADLVVVVPGGAALDINLEEQWVGPGQPVSVLVRAAMGQALTATLGAQSVNLIESEPALYRATLTAPLAPGYHPLSVTDGRVERQSVVGVFSTAWQTGEARITEEQGQRAIQVELYGEGKVALGVRVLQGGEVMDTRLLGPFRYSLPDTHTLRHVIPWPEGDEDISIEWQLFDARRALTPITPLQSLP